MNNNEILKEYVLKFGYPPKIITIDFEDEIYIKLMKEALKRNSEILLEEIEQVVSKIDYDLVRDDEELSANAYAEKYSIE